MPVPPIAAAVSVSASLGIRTRIFMAAILVDARSVCKKKAPPERGKSSDNGVHPQRFTEGERFYHEQNPPTMAPPAPGWRHSLTGEQIMGSIYAWTILIGGLFYASEAAHAQQQRGATPRFPISGAAIAVAPPQDGQPAAWVTNGGLVLYCIRQPPADPNDPKQNPAGRVRCVGTAIGPPQSGGAPTSLTPIGDAAQN